MESPLNGSVLKGFNPECRPNRHLNPDLFKYLTLYCGPYRFSPFPFATRRLPVCSLTPLSFCEAIAFVSMNTGDANLNLGRGSPSRDLYWRVHKFLRLS